MKMKKRKDIGEFIRFHLDCIQCSNIQAVKRGINALRPYRKIVLEINGIDVLQCQKNLTEKLKNGTWKHWAGFSQQIFEN